MAVPQRDVPTQPPVVSGPALRERRGVVGWLGRMWHRVIRTPR